MRRGTGPRLMAGNTGSPTAPGEQWEELRPIVTQLLAELRILEQKHHAERDRWLSSWLQRQENSRNATVWPCLEDGSCHDDEHESPDLEELLHRGSDCSEVQRVCTESCIDCLKPGIEDMTKVKQITPSVDSSLIRSALKCSAPFGPASKDMTEEVEDDIPTLAGMQLESNGQIEESDMEVHAVVMKIRSEPVKKAKPALQPVRLPITKPAWSEQSDDPSASKSLAVTQSPRADSEKERSSALAFGASDRAPSPSPEPKSFSRRVASGRSPRQSVSKPPGSVMRANNSVQSVSFGPSPCSSLTTGNGYGSYTRKLNEVQANQESGAGAISAKISTGPTFAMEETPSKDRHVNFDTNMDETVDPNDKKGKVMFGEHSDMLDDNEDDDEDEDDYTHFWLHPVWMEQNEFMQNLKNKSKSKTKLLGSQSKSVLNLEENQYAPSEKTGSSTWWGRMLEPMIMNPNSFGRAMWDLLGCVMFCYDAVAIPLQFFDPPEVYFSKFMAWCVRIYWTMDILASLLTGVAHDLNGTVDLRPERVVRHYVRTWMTFDVLIVALDWSEMAGGLDEFGVARVGKLAKTIRMLRMFRVLKLMQTMRVPEVIKSFTYQFKSERLSIILGILKIMIAVVWCTHFVACFWYGLGTSVEYPNWVEHDKYERQNWGYVYATSFHWSLTQFTGSMEIVPHNTAERTFTILVLLFAFVISAFAVSSITTSMTRLELVTTQQSTQFAVLRQYLSTAGVSKVLAVRITRSAQMAVDEAKKHTPEADVLLLNLVSDPLKVELHYELNARVLITHPFFVGYDQVYTAALRQICHSGISRLNLHQGDVIFSMGEMPEQPRMLFVTDGKLLYLQDEVTPFYVKEGQWASEATLWTMWSHRGAMRAHTEARLLLLDSLKFQKVVAQFLSKEANPVIYAREFVRHLNLTPRNELTDLYDPELDLQGLADSVFLPEMQRRNSEHARSSGRQGSVLGFAWHHPRSSGTSPSHSGDTASCKRGLSAEITPARSSTSTRKKSSVWSVARIPSAVMGRLRSSISLSSATQSCSSMEGFQPVSRRGSNLVSVWSQNRVEAGTPNYRMSVPESVIPQRISRVSEYS